VTAGSDTGAFAAFIIAIRSLSWTIVFWSATPCVVRRALSFSRVTVRSRSSATSVWILGRQLGEALPQALDLVPEGRAVGLLHVAHAGLELRQVGVQGAVARLGIERRLEVRRDRVGPGHDAPGDHAADTGEQHDREHEDGEPAAASAAGVVQLVRETLLDALEALERLVEGLGRVDHELVATVVLDDVLEHPLPLVHLLEQLGLHLHRAADLLHRLPRHRHVPAGAVHRGNRAVRGIRERLAVARVVVVGHRESSVDAGPLSGAPAGAASESAAIMSRRGRSRNVSKA
jgi:hypothetical protein